MELLLSLTLKAQKHAIEMLYGGIQRFALDGLGRGVGHIFVSLERS